MRFARLFLLLALLPLTSCATGKDAVSQSDTFEFVSPGGQTNPLSRAAAQKDSEHRGPEPARAIAESGRGRGIRVLGLDVRDNPK